MTMVADQCNLLTDTFAKFIQLFLAVIAISTLWIKREMEVPKRKFEVWGLDVSKQGIGALMVHCLNLVLSMFFSSTTGDDVDECGVYFMTFVTDVTIGTLIIYFLLPVVEWFAKRCNWSALVSTGDYGDPPSYATWATQLIAWLFIQSLMKLIVSCFIWLAFDMISSAGTVLFAVFSHHRHLELFVVMIAGPCIMNALQFWVIDSLLKEKKDRDEFIPLCQDDGETFSA